MAPASLVLYGDPFSANTRIVTIVLEMLEMKYEFRTIDVMHGDHLSSNFQKVSGDDEEESGVPCDALSVLTPSRAV